MAQLSATLRGVSSYYIMARGVQYVMTNGEFRMHKSSAVCCASSRSYINALSELVLILAYITMALIEMYYCS
jgi:hypothetical protein